MLRGIQMKSTIEQDIERTPARQLGFRTAGSALGRRDARRRAGPRAYSSSSRGFFPPERRIPAPAAVVLSTVPA